MDPALGPRLVRRRPAGPGLRPGGGLARGGRPDDGLLPHPSSLEDLVTVTFTGLLQNAAPQVSASTTAAVFRPGLTVTLSAAGSDNDGDSLTYSWTQLSGTPVTINNANTAQANVTSPNASGSLTFRVTANDGTGAPNATGTSDVSFSVNRPPALVVMASPGSGPPGTFVTLDGAGTTDPDDAGLVFAWTEVNPPGGSPVSLSNANTSTATFTCPSYTGTTAERRRTFRLTVTDGMGAPGAVSANVIFNPNRKPVLGAITAAGDRVIFYSNSGTTSDRTETLTGNSNQGNTALDADGDALTWSWRVVSGPLTQSSLFSSTTNRSPTFGAPKPNSSNANTGGVYTLGVTASDGAETSDEVQVVVLVTSSFAGDIYPLLTGACNASGCHNASAQGGLRMDQGASAARTSLINTGNINPNNYSSSEFYNRLNSGNMPSGGQPWTGNLQFQTNMVRDWLEPEHNVFPKPGLANGADNN